jgi:anthranilate synthase component 1
MFAGGLVGYFGYDCVRMVEPRLAASAPPDVLGTPDILLMVAEEFLVFDNLAGAIALVVTVDPREADAPRPVPRRGSMRCSSAWRGRRRGCRRWTSMPGGATASVCATSRRRSSRSSAVSDFEAAVERIKEYILAGDVMQVVPSQRMSMPFRAAPIDLYRALRCT